MHIFYVKIWHAWYIFLYIHLCNFMQPHSLALTVGFHIPLFINTETISLWTNFIWQALLKLVSFALITIINLKFHCQHQRPSTGLEPSNRTISSMIIFVMARRWSDQNLYNHRNLWTFNKLWTCQAIRSRSSSTSSTVSSIPSTILCDERPLWHIPLPPSLCLGKSKLSMLVSSS